MAESKLILKNEQHGAVRIIVDGNFIGVYYPAPTHNCQLGSFGDFEEVLSYCSNKQLKQLFEQLIAEYCKPLILIDVRYYIFDIMFKRFGDTVISTTRYKNTTSNEMVMCIINIEEVIRQW